MNGVVSWPADVYIKPEVQTPPETAARPDVVMGQLTERATPIGSDSRNLGERNVPTCVEKTDDDVRSRSSKSRTSPEVDRREAVTERGLAGAGYKYKDNIKRRFCSESDAQAPPSHAADTRSYSSLSDGASSAPDYSPPSSPGVPPPSAPVRDDRVPPGTCTCGRALPAGDDRSQRSPGFVLHPSGAFYVPVIAATARLQSLLSAPSQSAAVVCHPVSIPVRFTGSDDGAATAEVVCVNDAASAEQHRSSQRPSLLQLQRL